MRSNSPHCWAVSFLGTSLTPSNQFAFWNKTNYCKTLCFRCILILRFWNVEISLHFNLEFSQCVLLVFTRPSMGKLNFREYLISRFYPTRKIHKKSVTAWCVACCWLASTRSCFLATWRQSHSVVTTSSWLRPVVSETLMTPIGVAGVNTSCIAASSGLARAVLLEVMLISSIKVSQWPFWHFKHCSAECTMFAA